jgi:succinoglycan biosynthesis protein ExoA
MSIQSLSLPRTAGHRPADQSARLSISVVVPVRNEAAFIERTLGQLLSQDYDPRHFEILVVDGESTDDTAALAGKVAERFPNVRLLANPRRLSSAARNIGIRNARGDVVVIVDGHCELDDDQYLKKLANAFERSGADCIGRPQPLDTRGATALQRAIAAARSSRLGHHPDSHIYSAREEMVPAESVAVAYRRSVFDKVGFFDERFDACEDVELNHRIDRAGLRCFFTPDVVVRYVPRATYRGLFRQMARYGRGRVRLWRKHRETLSLPSFLPGLFVLGCILGLGAMWVSKWLATAYLAVLLLYAAVLLAGSAAIAVRQRRLALLPWLPLALAAIHTGAGAGILVEAAIGSRRTGNSR